MWEGRNIKSQEGANPGQKCKKKGPKSVSHSFIQQDTHELQVYIYSYTKRYNPAS